MPFSNYAYIHTESDFFIWTVLGAVFLVQMVFGLLTPGQSHHPPYLWWFAQSLSSALASKLDRKNRTKSTLFIRGVLAVIFLLVVAISVVRLADVLAHRVEFGWLIVPFLIWGSVNLSVPWRALRHMMAAKDVKALSKRGKALSDLTGLKFKSSDPHTIARAAILYTCSSFVRYAVAPIIIFGFLGLNWGVAYVFLAAGTGYDFVGVGLSHPYSKLRRALQLVFEFIPVRAAAIYIYLSAILTPTAHPKACLEILFDGGQRFTGSGLSFAIKAFAAATGVSLGGGLSYKDGVKISRPWVGYKNATAKADIADIKRAFVLHVFASVFILLTILLILA